MRMLLVFITALLLLSSTAQASFVSDDEAPDVVTCDTVETAKSNVGNFVVVTVIKNMTTEPLSIHWRSFLGESVKFVETIEPGKIERLKFMNGSYFVVSQKATSECVDVFKSRIKPQVIVYK